MFFGEPDPRTQVSPVSSVNRTPLAPDLPTTSWWSEDLHVFSGSRMPKWADQRDSCGWLVLFVRPWATSPRSCSRPRHNWRRRRDLDFWEEGVGGRHCFLYFQTLGGGTGQCFRFPGCSPPHSSLAGLTEAQPLLV